MTSDLAAQRERLTSTFIFGELQPNKAGMSTNGFGNLMGQKKKNNVINECELALKLAAVTITM